MELVAMQKGTNSSAVLSQIEIITYMKVQSHPEAILISFKLTATFSILKAKSGAFC